MPQSDGEFLSGESKFSALREGLKAPLNLDDSGQSPAILINPTIEKRTGGQFSLVRAGDPPGFPPAHG